MKIKLFLVIVFLLSTGLISFSQQSEILGDANNNGSVDIIDALIIAQYYVGLDPAGFYIDLADANCDSQVNIVDALIVSQFYVGLITEMPCQITPEPTPTPTDVNIETPTPTPDGNSNLELQYKNGDPNLATNWIKPNFKIRNNGITEIPLSEITVRYWYTCEPGSAGTQGGQIDWAAIGNENITLSFFSTSSTIGADTYCEFGFTSDAPTLSSGGDTGDIVAAIHDSSWANYDQSDDYSYGSNNEYLSWDKMTVYRNGILVWGYDPPQSPSAVFSYSPDMQVFGREVSFDATASTDPNGTIISYTWDFGDGYTGSGSVTTHIFASPDNYNVKLTVTDNENLSVDTSITITIYDGNPFARFSFSPDYPLPGETVSFNAADSFDIDGTVSSYSWQFGDGHTGSGSLPSHSYAKEGYFLVSLTVTDNSGKTGTESDTVHITTQRRPFFEDYKIKQAPPLISSQRTPTASSGSSVSIDVFTDQKIMKILPTIMGNNTAVWAPEKYLCTPVTIQRLKQVNISLFRFPGGSTSNKYHWDGIYPPYALAQGWENMSADWTVDTIEYYKVCKEIGGIPAFTVNYGYHEYDTTETDGNVENAARLAASWVEYCNAPNDGSNPGGGIDYAAQRASDGVEEPMNVKYWTIGNEVYGNWSVGTETNGADYGANFNIIYDAMKAIDPSIYIGIVVQLGNNKAKEWTAAALSTPGVAERADFVEPHEYFHYITSSDITEEEILNLVSMIAQDKIDIDTAIINSMGKSPDDIKLYMGEYNMTNPHNYHNTQLVSALFISRVLGEMIINEYGAASLWDTINGWNDNAGRGFGDHGFLSKKNPDVPDLMPYPTYYPFFFFTRNFGDNLVESQETDPDIFVYASTFSSGEVGLIIINQASANKTATINLNGFSINGNVNIWDITGSTLADYLVKVNGQTSGYTYCGPPIEDVVPYHINAGAGSQITVNLEKYSVTSIVIY